MSIVICEGCDAPVDSDFDGDCFVEVGNMRRLHETKVLCERCRERRIQACDVCDEPVDIEKDPHAINEVPACCPPHLAKNLEGVTCDNCRERAWDRHNESFYG